MENPDQISSLPDGILLRLLCFLELKEAIKTSMIARKWRYLYRKVPILNFEYNQFSHPGDGKARAFNEFINWVFALRDSNSDVQKFSFSCCDLDKPNGLSSNHLFVWIALVLKRNIQELYLNIPLFNEDFNLPHYSLSTCSSLKKLELKISEDSHFFLNLPDSIRLPSLETLILSGVWIVGDKVLGKIFSSSPVLESLTMTQCEFSQRHVDIIAPKLKLLVIEDLYYSEDDRKGYSINLCAPNLISFFWKDFVTKEYSVKNLPALVKAAIDMHPEAYAYKEDGDQISKVEMDKCGQRAVEFLKALHSVKDLSLSNRFLDQLVSQDWCASTSSPIQFCNLRCLRLGTVLSEDSVKTITSLLDISPNIESLFLQGDEVIHQMPPPWYRYWDEVKLIDREKVESSWRSILTWKDCLYQLKFVEIQGVQGRLNEMLFLRFLLKHATNLEQMIIFTSKDNGPTRAQRLNNFNKDLLSLPRASSSIGICLFM